MSRTVSPRAKIAATFAALAMVVGGSVVVTQTDEPEAQSEATVVDRLTRLECEVFGECPPPPVAECEGVRVEPTQNLAQVAASNPPGTTFCLDAGSYRTAEVVLQDGDSLVGEDVDQTFIEGSGRHVINASDTSAVTISDLDVSGATGDSTCRPKCGRGVWPGTDTLIERVHSHHNANLGIGGGEQGLVVRDVELSHNGSQDFLGCCAGGIKSGNSFTITGSFVHDNTGNGIWCDHKCPRFVATDNISSDNTRNGIRFEHGAALSDADVAASSALIEGNTVQRNNTSRNTPGAGIEINSASNAEVLRNILGGTIAAHGIIVRGERHPTVNIQIVDNVLNGDTIGGSRSSSLAKTPSSLLDFVARARGKLDDPSDIGRVR